MKKLLTLLLTAGALTMVHAQMYYDDGRLLYTGDSTLEGNAQTLGINPANLGRTNDRHVAGSALQIGGNFYSNGLKLNQLFDLTFSDQVLTDTVKNLLVGQNSDPTEDFSYDGNIDINWIAFSWVDPKIGGFAFNVQERLASSATIPNSFLGVLLQGTDADAFDDIGSLEDLEDLSAIGDGTRVFYSHIRVARLGYGRQVMNIDDQFKLYLGGTLQALWGIGYYQGDVTDGQFESQASFSEAYRINYGQFNPQDPADQRRLLSSSGRGLAFDFGVSMDIAEKLNLGFSLVDIGSLEWTDNLQATTADIPTMLDSVQEGFINSYDLNAEVGNIYDQVESVASTPFKTLLNTQARINGSYRFTDRLVVGGDLVLPFRGESRDALDKEALNFTGSVSWAIIPQTLYATSGVIVSPRFGYRWPAGVALRMGTLALSVTTGDFLTFLTDRNPYASLSIALVAVGK